MEGKRRIIEDHGKVAFYNDDSILLRQVRCSYPHLDKPWTMGEGEPKYQMEGMIPKTKEYEPGLRALKARINAIIRENKTAELPESRLCLKDGASTGKPEKADYYVFKASENNAPKLRGRRRDPRTGMAEVIPNEDANKVFYGGCWVNMVVKFWWQNNKHGKRVNANLLIVQFVQDDDAFGRGRISDDDVDDFLDEIEDEGDNEDPF